MGFNVAPKIQQNFFNLEWDEGEKMTTTIYLKLVTKVISSILESNTHLDSYEAYWGVLCGVHVLQHKMSSDWDTPKQEEEVHSMIHKLSGVSVWSTYETILLCSEVPQGQKGLEMNYKSKKKKEFCVIQTKTKFIVYIWIVWINADLSLINL